MPAKTLTKAQLAEKLASDAQLDRRSAVAFLDALTAHVHGTLRKGGTVKLHELGQFKVVKRKARMGRNPQTGQAIKIPARTTAKFALARGLKDLAKK